MQATAIKLNEDCNFDQLFSNLKNKVESHTALVSLKEFGVNLKKRPLNNEELKIYFATMWGFFRQIPTGILALALRVTDDWARYKMFEATSKGAHILFADVDEFGLQALHKKMHPTHHQLFSEFTQFLGVSPEDLNSKKYILKEGTDMGAITHDFYRNESIGAGLGFHLASELSSSIEFIYFLDGFSAHKDHYKIKSDNDPILTFFRIHTLVEPVHLEQSCAIIKSYLQKDQNIEKEVLRGASTFMDGFDKLFSILNQTIYR